MESHLENSNEGHVSDHLPQFKDVNEGYEDEVEGIEENDGEVEVRGSSGILYMNEFIPEAPDEIKPKIGLEFISEDDVYNFYNAYAKWCGFSIRKSQIKKLKTGEISRRVLRCSKEGQRQKKFLKMEVRKKRPRMLTRCECPALIVANRSKGLDKWVITKIIEKHSHKLMTPNKSHCLRSHRKVPNPQLDVAEEFNEVGVGVAKALDFFTGQAGGPDCLGFSERDMRNALRKRRYEKYGKGAHSLLSFFQNKSKEDFNFTYEIQFDQDCRLASCFWVDKTSKMDYQAFGDVICFDTTYKTNEFDLPFGPFVGVNHHRQSILLGAGLLFGETIEDFKWLFETWLAAMGGVPPKAIITDQDAAIAAAVAEVFPKAHHQLCMWHINKKLPEKLGHIFHEFPSFNSAWSNCVYKSKDIDEFEALWSRMIQEYDLQNNSWLLQMYNIRHMWIPAYSKKHFLAGMKTTGRSESINAMFDGYVNHKTKLLEFAIGYDKAVEKRRHSELRADCETSNGTPVLKTGHPIEEEMAKIYTREIFYEFQKEVNDSNFYVSRLVETEGCLDKYVVVHYLNQSKERMVLWDKDRQLASCPCHSFEFHGIICKHIISMFRFAMIGNMPPKHILKRSTRNAKERLRDFSCSSTTDVENSPLLRRHIMSQNCSYLINEATSHLEAYIIPKEYIEKATIAIRELNLYDKNDRIGQIASIGHEAGVCKKELDYIPSLQDGASDNSTINSSQANILLDPHVVPTKGRTNRRFKHPIEQSKSRGRLCSGCRMFGVGHDKRNCPLYKDRIFIETQERSISGDMGSDRGRGGKGDTSFTN